MSFDDQHAQETYRSLIVISTEALKSLQLLNGGAIVALLAYLGQADAPPDLGAVYGPLTIFISGLALGASAFFTAYFTQLALLNETVRGVASVKIRHGYLLWGTFALSALSLAAFAWGALRSAAVLTQSGS